MTLNGVMAVTLRYYTEFGKPVFQHITASICGGINARVYIVFCSACTMSSLVPLFSCSWRIAASACAQTAILQLPIKILTSSLHSATPFPKDSWNLAIRRRIHAVTLTFDPLTLNACGRWSVMCSNSVPNLSEMEQSAAELLIMQ